MSTVKIIVNLLCDFTRDEEADAVVAYCPRLNIFSQGADEAEAKEAIVEAMTLYLVKAFEMDRLDQILRRAGFSAAAGAGELSNIVQSGEFVAVATTTASPTKQIPIEVPLTLLAANYKRDYALCQ